MCAAFNQTSNVESYRCRICWPALRFNNAFWFALPIRDHRQDDRRQCGSKKCVVWQWCGGAGRTPYHKRCIPSIDLFSARSGFITLIAASSRPCADAVRNAPAYASPARNSIEKAFGAVPNLGPRRLPSLTNVRRDHLWKVHGSTAWCFVACARPAPRTHKACSRAERTTT